VKRAPLPGLDLGVYVSALPKLARNPSIVVVPLLMAIIGVLLTVTMASFSAGGVGSLTLGLAQLIELLLGLFGLGTACVIADDAWRHGRASFERGWTETQRRSGEIMMAAIGFGLLTSVALYLTQIVGLVGYLLTAVVIVFLIWTIPAAAVGGIPGGAAIQVSIERVRARPIPAIVATVVSLVLLGYVVPLVGSWIASLLLVWTVGSLLPELLIVALFQSIAVSYIALVITKIYTDDAFSTRRY
jgi:hypothetical protein